MRGYKPQQINLKNSHNIETSNKKSVLLELGAIDLDYSSEGGEKECEQGKRINIYQAKGN
jgi:hypothetical protein